MRLFEFFLLLIVSTYPILVLLKLKIPKKKTFAFFLGVILLLHFFLEGARWQMTPGYLMAFGLIFLLLKQTEWRKWSLLKKTFSIISFGIILALGWFLPIVLPVFNLPTPTGNLSIGSKDIHIQTDRPEIITLKEGDQRELMVKVWYPAQIENEDIEKYLDKGNRIGFAVKYGLPGWTMDYLDLIKTNTYKNPEIAKGKFPVLIFSHGHYSKAFGYYALIEEIVSHGYIVLNINHTYESTGSLFPNGEIQLYNTTYDSLNNDQQMAEMAWNATQKFNQAENAEDEFKAIENLLQDYIAAESIKRWSKDISSVIDHLESKDEFSFLDNHVLNSNIGVFGHSHGGAAAGQVLIEDDRVKAAINIDGTQWGSMVESTLDKPFAYISSEWPADQPNFNKHAFRNQSTADFYNITIENAGHSNFMDIPLMINFSAVNEAGNIDPFKAYKAVNSLVIEFFDKYLMDQSNDISKLEKEFQGIISIDSGF